MYIEKGFFVAVVLLALSFAVAWFATYYRASKAQKAFESLLAKDMRVEATVDRLSKDVERQRARAKKYEDLLMEVGGSLNNVQEPLAALKCIYELLKNQNKAFIMGSPLAFANKKGQSEPMTDHDKGMQLFHRLKNRA